MMIQVNECLLIISQRGKCISNIYIYIYWIVICYARIILANPLIQIKQRIQRILVSLTRTTWSSKFARTKHTDLSNTKSISLITNNDQVVTSPRQFLPEYNPLAYHIAIYKSHIYTPKR